MSAIADEERAECPAWDVQSRLRTHVLATFGEQEAVQTYCANILTGDQLCGLLDYRRGGALQYSPAALLSDNAALVALFNRYKDLFNRISQGRTCRRCKSNATNERRLKRKLEKARPRA